MHDAVRFVVFDVGRVGPVPQHAAGELAEVVVGAILLVDADADLPAVDPVAPARVPGAGAGAPHVDDDGRVAGHVLEVDAPLEEFQGLPLVFELVHVEVENLSVLLSVAGEGDDALVARDGHRVLLSVVFHGAVVVPAVHTEPDGLGGVRAACVAHLAGRGLVRKLRGQWLQLPVHIVVVIDDGALAVDVDLQGRVVPHVGGGFDVRLSWNIPCAPESVGVDRVRAVQRDDTVVSAAYLGLAADGAAVPVVAVGRADGRVVAADREHDGVLRRRIAHAPVGPACDQAAAMGQVAVDDHGALDLAPIRSKRKPSI